MDLFVDGFKWRYLYQLVDGLLNDRAGIRIDFLNRQRMSPVRHVLDKVNSRLACLNVNVVIHAIDHLRHLPRKCHTTCLQYQLRTIDVECLVLPWTLTAIEGLLYRTKKRTVGRLNRILACFIDL